jgi:hypothetical protein
VITRAEVAERLRQYLQGGVPLDQLVDWAERALMDADLDAADAAVIADALGRIGVADVREFGLSWEDCRDLLKKLGYRASVEVTAA